MYAASMSYTNITSGVYIFICIYRYNDLPNGCKDLVENWQI